jgi:signal transduction histidine kinase
MVLVAVFFGINLYMKSVVENRALYSLESMSQDLGGLQRRFENSERADMYNYFYILLADANGKAPIEISPNAPEDIEVFIPASLEAHKSSGRISIDGMQYWYVINPTENALLLLYMADEGSDFFSSLQGVSLVVGAISVILAMFVSLILAMRALRPVRDAWEKQQAFVADASHKLRTPLAILSTNLEAVMESPDELVSEQGEWLTNMRNEITRMSKLVEELLFLARADAKTDTFASEHFFLSDLMKKITAAFLPVARDKNIAFHREIQTDVKILGMESRVSQLLVILIDNAIKNTPEGGEIRISLSAKHGKPVVQISDTGVGISDEHLSHIFTRFYRTDSARTRDDGGAGLGLAIAKHIVEEHSGSIDVQSKVGSGTTFQITFPA